MYTYPEKIICVTNRRLCAVPLEKQTEIIISELGIKRFILREKDLPENEYAVLAEKMLGVCEKYGAELIIHSYEKTARSLGIDRIHMPLGLIGTDTSDRYRILGVSVHSAAEAALAEKLGADYLTAGHIFATDCKKGVAPRGTQFLSEVCETGLPVYAIGGISEDNFEDILRCGAAGGCIMSGLMKFRPHSGK